MLSFFSIFLNACAIIPFPTKNNENYKKDHQLNPLPFIKVVVLMVSLLVCLSNKKKSISPPPN